MESRYGHLLTAVGAFEPPSNLLLKRLRPSVWLPTIMVAWYVYSRRFLINPLLTGFLRGIVMTCMGTVHNYEGLLSSRLFLGVAEAGLFPGVAYFLSGQLKT